MKKKQLKVLYPDIKPYNSGMLDVSLLHSMYYEECGNPKGIPVLFVHGGPGVGLDPMYRRFFNPRYYRIILFDQRGCGRSLSNGKPLEENTTWDLVADMEKLRCELGIDQWMLFGGSWAATLILAYAQKYPQHVSAMILRGIWLSTKEEIKWLYQSGAHLFRPDAWEYFLAPIPESERDNLIKAYHQRLTSKDEEIVKKYSRAWVTWTESTYALKQSTVEEIRLRIDDVAAIINAQIECHYFLNNAFLEEDQLIKNINSVRHIPATLIQGQYDLCCPPSVAWRLHKAWPEVTLKMVHAGHSSFSTEMLHVLIDATDAYRFL